MASYKEAVAWIASNDGAGDTPEGMDYAAAHDDVRSMISVCLVADVWGKIQDEVAVDVLKVRGFKKPRTFTTAALG